MRVTYECVVTRDLKCDRCASVHRFSVRADNLDTMVEIIEAERDKTFSDCAICSGR